MTIRYGNGIVPTLGSFLLVILAACGDGTGPEPDEPRIEAPAVVSVVAHASGPYCPLSWTLVGDVEWERGLLVLRNGNAEVGRSELDVPVVLHGRLDVSGDFTTAHLSLPWRTETGEGVAEHTFRCER